MLSGLTNLQPRQLAAQVLNFLLVLSSAFMMWKGISAVTNCSSPIVVVLSASMEPAFARGDLLFLWNRSRETQVGEVVIYNAGEGKIPIVHRVVRRFGGGNAPLHLLTKGDNNGADDVSLYENKKLLLDRDRDVIGSVRAFVPLVGYATIVMSDYPWLKTVMIGLMGLSVVFQRD